MAHRITHPVGGLPPLRARACRCRSRLDLAALAWVVLTAVAGCNGGGDALTSRPTSKTTATTQAITADATVVPSAQAFPGDGAAPTQQRRYATRQQAEALQQAMPDEVLVLDVDCCGVAPAEQAVNIAFAVQAAHDHSDDVPVLVRGADQETAAMVADRLARAGMTRVWLVTP
jgi:hypothetical protein